MSTRSSFFYHQDAETGIKIHIFEEAEFAAFEVRLEIEHPFGVTNVLWPYKQFIAGLPDFLQKSKMFGKSG